MSRRALVHFAVDPDRVAMTTKLAGQQTRFLPFNVGHDGGAGNPPNPDGHRTSYLCERVWARDAWMDILGRFVHVTRPEKGSPAAKKAAEEVIFPRLHQWDAVLKLEADARERGAGQSYLVQHSAGSGKFKALDEEQRLAFKDAPDKFVRTYAFVSQIVSFGDSKLERDYAYCRALASRLRDQNTVERLDLGSEVELTHLRHEITFEGSLALTADEAEIKSITGDGRGGGTEPDIEPLSKIIDVLNEQFGLNLGDADELFFDQIEESFVADDVMAQARANTFDNFRLAFDPKFLGTVIGRMDENEALFKRMLDDQDFQEAVKDEYAARVYKRARTVRPT